MKTTKKGGPTHGKYLQHPAEERCPSALCRCSEQPAGQADHYQGNG